MEIQKASEIMDRFFKLLEKQTDENEQTPSLYKKGEVIPLVIEAVAKDGALVLSSESAMDFAAILFNVDRATPLGAYIYAMRSGGWSFALDVQCKEPLKSFNEKLSLFIQQRKAKVVDIQKFLSAIQPLTDVEFVTGLIELIREVDPERADEVAAAMRGEIQCRDDEIAALKMQLAEMQKQRDEAVDIAKKAMEMSHDDSPDPSAEAQSADAQHGKQGKNGKKGRQEINRLGQNGTAVTDMIADAQPVNNDQEHAA